MLDIKRIRENFAEVVEGLQRRGAPIALAESVRDLDLKRRALVTRTDELKNLRNSRSKEIGALKKSGQDTTQVQGEVRTLGDQITELDAQLRLLEDQLESAMLQIPNIPCASTPTGADASANRVVKVVGAPPVFDFPPLDHITLGERLGLFDLPRGAKITGSGFPLMLGAGARLQRALIQFMLDMHTEKHGYIEMLPPFVVNSASMRGTGQLPKMAEDMYHCQIDDLWLIPTGEVPATNYFRDEILDRPLPIYLTAYTPCFRREAGSAGKDTRGILRVHQFDKVEMIKFVAPETSYAELESLVADAEEVLTTLGLHYRVLELCSGDISFAAAKCYDIELWSPAQQAWIEVSSCSNFEDFQARRLNCRYRDANGKIRLVHTLNGSGVALPRLMIAIIEQCQQADGSIVLPVALRPYLRGLERL